MTNKDTYDQYKDLLNLPALTQAIHAALTKICEIDEKEKIIYLPQTKKKGEKK